MPARYLLTINLRAGGGAERQIVRLYESGCADAIIALERRNEHGVPAEHYIALSDHDESDSQLGKALKILYLPVYAWRLAKVLPRDGEVTVMSFLERANFVNVLAKPLRRHRAVINLQVHVFTHYRGALMRLNLALIRLLYGRADLVTANSRRTLEDLRDAIALPATRCRVIPNVYDGERLRALAAEPLAPLARRALAGESLLASGRLVAQKAPWRLLRAFAELRRRRRGVRLVVLSDGELREPMIAMARDLGLDVFSVFDNGTDGTDGTGGADGADGADGGEAVATADHDVWFLGMQRNPYQHFSNCALSLHPSFYEGLPNALIEAMTVGACCVASDCPSGPREVLAPESDVRAVAERPEWHAAGVLMPPFTEDLPFADRAPDREELFWADTIEALLDDPERIARLRRGARERAEHYALGRLGTYLDGVF